MRATAKYLFDVDFSGAEAKPTVLLTEHQVMLAEAEAVGYRNGVAAAEAQALTDSSRLTALALERLVGVLGGLHQALHAVEAKLEAEAVEVAVAVGRKLAPALIAREPLAEIEALATECFKQLVTTPHVVVRVNDALHATARGRLEEIARLRGFEGRLVVIAEPDVAPGDCRVEWADGGLNRDSAATEAAITEAVGRYVAACRAAANRSGEPT